MIHVSASQIALVLEIHVHVRAMFHARAKAIHHAPARAILVTTAPAQTWAVLYIGFKK